MCGCVSCGLIMHDSSAQGNDFFKCDFCRRGWSDDRPMVEGHKGSLICAACLTVACAEVLIGKQGEMGVRGPVHPASGEGPWCTLCLERRAQLYWASPMHPEVKACTRCIRQSASVLEKDPDFNWKRPRAEGETEPPADADDDDGEED